MRLRKTRHDYWNFPQEIQEHYLNLRHQIGYLEAGYFLERQSELDDFLKVLQAIVVAKVFMEITFFALKKAGLLKKECKK